jgi:hypothetical protein
MVAEGHRLGRLQVGVAGHQHVGMRLGLVDQRALQVHDRGVDRVDRASEPQPEIGHHLVVAAACGVQPAGRLAHQFLEAGLHIHVDVLELGLEGEAAVGDLALDRAEPVEDRVAIGLRDDPARRQHLGMRLRAADILRRETPVDVDRGVDFLHDGRGACGEAPAPHLVRTHPLPYIHPVPLYIALGRLIG